MKSPWSLNCRLSLQGTWVLIPPPDKRTEFLELYQAYDIRKEQQDLKIFKLLRSPIWFGHMAYPDTEE